MTARIRSGAVARIGRGRQRVGTAGREGFDGRSGSRSGRTSGGGAGAGVSTGSTVIVRDGPSSEPVRWERERRGGGWGECMAGPSCRSTGGGKGSLRARFEAFSCRGGVLGASPPGGPAFFAFSF